MGRCPVIGTRPSRASATARSDARTSLQATRYDFTVGAWFNKYGLPSETRTVERVESVALIRAASESGRALVPRPERGRTLAANTVPGARAIPGRAES